MCLSWYTQIRKKNRSKRSDDYSTYVHTNLVRLYSIIPGPLADRLADLMRGVVSVKALEALFSVQAEVVPKIRGEDSFLQIAIVSIMISFSTYLLYQKRNLVIVFLSEQYNITVENEHKSKLHTPTFV